jgi:hypothetical protein
MNQCFIIIVYTTIKRIVIQKYINTGLVTQPLMHFYCFLLLKSIFTESKLPYFYTQAYLGSMLGETIIKFNDILRGCLLLLLLFE